MPSNNSVVFEPIVDFRSRTIPLVSPLVDLLNVGLEAILPFFAMFFEYAVFTLDESLHFVQVGVNVGVLVHPHSPMSLRD